MMKAREEYFASHGEPLFSSHKLDLSEEPLEENIAICMKYLERMAKVNMLVEMVLGVTGCDEDGVDNSNVDSSRLYTQPEEVWQVYEALSSVPNGNFTVATAFGNRHGVYTPGNVSLQPELLHNTQKFIKEPLTKMIFAPLMVVVPVRLLFYQIADMKHPEFLMHQR
jgi:fructose-bisphosphate aldolase class II